MAWRNRSGDGQPSSGGAMTDRRIEEQDEDMRGGGEQGDENFLMPDRDFFRKRITTFQNVHTFYENKLHKRSFRERAILQPHYTAFMNRETPYASATRGDAGDGVCAHFLRKGFTKPTKTHFNCAVWSSDAKWLVLGTEYGDLATWEGESLKVKKMLSMVPHKMKGDQIANTSITAIARNRHGKNIVTGDASGLFQFCDETFRTSFIKEEAHNGAIHGLSFGPFDSKLVSAGEDALIHLWTVGQNSPDTTFHGHQSDIKCLEWHPFRSLIASGSRDSAVRLWDPRAKGECVSILTSHKKQVNCLNWNPHNGNWLATGAKDGLLKVFDIRVMKEYRVYRGHNCDVTSVGWHPQHESLLLSGGYNGSLCYWVTASGSEAPHTAIAGAHRQFIDVIAWHPEGHLCATASNDCVIKFWGREPPGSNLDIDEKEMMGSTFHFGPLPMDTPSTLIPPPQTLSAPDLRNTAGLVDVRDLRAGTGSAGASATGSSTTTGTGVSTSAPAPAAAPAPTGPLSAAQNLARIQEQVAARMASQRPGVRPAASTPALPTTAPPPAPPMPPMPPQGAIPAPPQINLAALPQGPHAGTGGIYGPGSQPSHMAPPNEKSRDPRKRRRT